MKKNLTVNSTEKTKTLKLWVSVLITMIVIIGVWYIIFLPITTRDLNSSSDFGNFASFRQDLKQAFSILKTKETPPQEQTEDISQEALREKVFGAQDSKL